MPIDRDPEELPVPEFVEWSIYPFEGDVRVRRVEPFEETEHLRVGDPGGPPCPCPYPDDDFLWCNDRFGIRRIDLEEGPTPFPAYMLGTREHLDFGDFDESLAAEFGVMSLRLERAMMAIGSIGRVHINRWSDGGSHFHVWFLGRPRGAWQMGGFTLPLWMRTLPPMDEAVAEANDLIVERELAAHDG